MVDIKSKQGRKVTTGDPLIVVRNGQIMGSVLKSSRLDINALQAMLKNIFSLIDVDYAILETNRQLSVLKKESKQAVTRSDISSISSKKLYSS